MSVNRENMNIKEIEILDSLDTTKNNYGFLITVINYQEQQIVAGRASIHSSHAVSVVVYAQQLHFFNPWGDAIKHELVQKGIDDALMDKLAKHLNIKTIIHHIGPNLQSSNGFGSCVGYSSNFIPHVISKLKIDPYVFGGSSIAGNTNTVTKLVHNIITPPTCQRKMESELSSKLDGNGILTYRHTQSVMVGLLLRDKIQDVVDSLYPSKPNKPSPKTPIIILIHASPSYNNAFYNFVKEEADLQKLRDLLVQIDTELEMSYSQMNKLHNTMTYQNNTNIDKIIKQVNMHSNSLKQLAETNKHRMKRVGNTNTISYDLHTIYFKLKSKKSKKKKLVVKKLLHAIIHTNTFKPKTRFTQKRNHRYRRRSTLTAQAPPCIRKQVALW
jgi:hypothetical protein